MDEFFQIRESGVGEVSRSWILGEQCWRHQIHANIGALSREDRCHQELERILMVQSTRDVGILLLQPLENLVHRHFRFLQGILRLVRLK